MSFAWISFLIFGCFLVVSGSEEQPERKPKLFSVFNVVTFPNDACKGSTNNGTCYTSAECSSKGGSNVGSCASGYGVCCVFDVNCGASSSENCTYFTNTGGEQGACKVKICPCSNNICQLRLDFQTFQIAGPSTATDTVGTITAGSPTPGGGVAYTTAGQCLTDQFSVTSPGNPTPPTICGTNTGEHMYIESNSCDCNLLNFNIGTTATTRQWNIKVTQYSCDYNNLAPDGCTKYFFGSNGGTVQSYNFNNGNGQQLADQRDKMCIRRERGNCRICYTVAEAKDFSLTNEAETKTSTTKSSGLVGEESKCCGYGMDGLTNTKGFDCVIIPGAMKVSETKKFLENDEYCGQGCLVAVTGASKGKCSTLATSICSNKIPFQVQFVSDTYEVALEAMTGGFNKGLRLTYVQQTCN